MISAAWRFSERACDFALRKTWQWRGTWVLQLLGVDAAKSVRYYGMPIVTRWVGSEIRIGERVVLCSHPRFTQMGVARPVILRTLAPSARITIGDDTGLSGAVVCAAAAVDIGRQCLFGADVQVVDTDFHPVVAAGRRFETRRERIGSARVVIEDNVFLGAGVRVLKGVRIGRDSVVGAGSVVVSDIPPGVVAAGVPARIIGPLPPEGA